MQEVVCDLLRVVVFRYRHPLTDTHVQSNMARSAESGGIPLSSSTDRYPCAVQYGASHNGVHVAFSLVLYCLMDGIVSQARCLSSRAFD